AAAPSGPRPHPRPATAPRWHLCVRPLRRTDRLHAGADTALVGRGGQVDARGPEKPGAADLPQRPTPVLRLEAARLALPLGMMPGGDAPTFRGWQLRLRGRRSWG